MNIFSLKGHCTRLRTQYIGAIVIRKERLVGARKFEGKGDRNEWPEISFSIGRRLISSKIASEYI
jgi:hypothetical protein